MLAALVVAAGLSGKTFAGEKEHYTNGVEGLKGGTLPPAGNYYRMYNVFYQADELKDKNGKRLNVDFDLNVFANVHRFVHVSDETKILGGNFFADVTIPVVYQDAEMGAMGIKDNDFGLGDINIEPFGICWHGGQLDTAVGLSVFVPTGKFDKNNPASAGRDMWTGMGTVGATCYFDKGRVWHAAILSRYEVHSRKDHSDVKLGDDFHFEWGIGKTVNKFWDVGVAGYAQWQVSKDSGADVTWDKSVRDRVYAIGPEILGFFPNDKMFLSFRYLWEFGAKDRGEGNVAVVTFTRVF